MVNQYTFINNALAALQANGFTVGNTDAACELQPLSKQIRFRSLFCSPATYTVPNAGQTYVFTDTVHPTTTHLHALFARLVERAVTAEK